MLTSESESEHEDFDRKPVSKTNLKKFNYPECWKNDERMDRLFAPFRARSVNPEGYDIKVDFWKDMIRRYCEYNGSPNFSKSELQKALQRKGKVPYGLDIVLNDFIIKKEVRKRSEFVYDPLNSWTGWAMNSFVKKPILWGVQKIVTKPASDDVFTHLELASEMTENLQALLSEHAGRVIRFSSLKSFMSKNRLHLNEDGLNITLHNLNFQKIIFVEYEFLNNRKVPKYIKVPKPGNIATPIEPTDVALLELEDSQVKLAGQLTKIEEEIKEHDNMVRQLMKEGKKPLAKSYLRKRHLCEKKHESLSKSLLNIETSLMSVEQAQTNREVIGAYKIASAAMKTSQPNMDEVERVMDNLQDTMDDHREVEETLGKSIVPQEDEDDLEKELEDLMGEEEVPAAENNNTQLIKDPKKIPEISDKELIDLLEGLEVENNSPVKDVNLNQ
ncbi:CHMP7 family protein [Megaselia abdita]